MIKENIDIEDFRDETNKKILQEIYNELDKENANKIIKETNLTI